MSDGTDREPPLRIALPVEPVFDRFETAEQS
jgi:hypothetical protein